MHNNSNNNCNINNNNSCNEQLFRRLVIPFTYSYSGSYIYPPFGPYENTGIPALIQSLGLYPNEKNLSSCFNFNYCRPRRL